MRKGEATLLGLLALSVAANVVLGTQLHDRSKVTTMDYAVYGSFLSSLNYATEALDRATTETGRLKTEDVMRANMALERAVGILSGLRSEGEKRGLDFGPVMFAVLASELPSPEDPAFSNQENDLIQKTKKMIRQIQAGLQGTTYQNGEELSKLRAALNSLNSQLPYHP
jgi:hypothetical protein